MSDKKYDLFNNPMVDSAKKALSKEQVEEYKKVGKYMYSTNFQTTEAGSVEKPPQTEDILGYAIEGLKAGLNPMELSETEIRALIDVYGEKWYEKYGWEEDEVPKPVVQVISEAEYRENEKEHKLSRQQRRYLDRKKKKI